MTNKTILLVEDDARLASMLQEYLAGFSFQVKVTERGQEALAQLRQHTFDLIILDLMLPDMSGLDVCKQLRAFNNTPVLILTAKGDPVDRIIGLEIGADDYLPKPFEPRELVARLHALLRRQRAPSSTAQRRFGDLLLDLEAMTAYLDGAPCDLSTQQFQLLEILSRHPGRVHSRASLQRQLQGTDIDASPRSIDIHISRIRNKIERDPRSPQRILTIRGCGYIFSPDQAPEDT